jgi:hypothetical protein
MPRRPQRWLIRHCRQDRVGSAPSLQRKLAPITAADVVGYSRGAARNELRPSYFGALAGQGSITAALADRHSAQIKSIVGDVLLRQS